jgi:hypothetical protein
MGLPHRSDNYSGLYFPTLLHQGISSKPTPRLSSRNSSQTGCVHNFKINNPDHTPNFRTFTKVALRRPIRLFFTEPIVFVVSIMSATGWALIYLFTEALPAIYSSFSLSRQQSSLLFLGMAVGLLFGIIPRLIDQHILHQRVRDDFSGIRPLVACSLCPTSKQSPLVRDSPWHHSHWLRDQ